MSVGIRPQARRATTRSIVGFRRPTGEHAGGQLATWDLTHIFESRGGLHEPRTPNPELRVNDLCTTFRSLADRCGVAGNLRASALRRRSSRLSCASPPGDAD